MINRNRPSKPLRPLYPDVLGEITGGQRINMDAMEVALGIYPHMAYLNQPMELVVVLQNMIDQEIQIKMAVRTPNTDPNGNVVIIEMGKPQVSFAIGPGEVGVFRMPVVARPPTQPSESLPLRVAIRFRAPTGNRVRPPGGGAPPTMLSISPFKLQVLREVEFIAHKWNESTDILTADFKLAPKTIPAEPGSLKPRYESLWTQEGLSKEIRLVQAQYDEALEIARPAPTGSLYPAMIEAVKERFGARGMPLHPGETMAIAKMMCYTVEDAPTREPNVVLEDTRWFRSLCHVLAANPEMIDEDRNIILSKHVFEGIIYDAVLTGFRILDSKVEENMGDAAERMNYANRFMQWFTGHGETDLTYVYLPLVLGGLGIARLVRSGLYENAWDIADQLEEAVQGRLDLLSSDNVVIFDMMDSLLDSYKRILQARRIPRPEDVAAQSKASLPGKVQPLGTAPTANDNGNNSDSDDPPRRRRLSGREL